MSIKSHVSRTPKGKCSIKLCELEINYAATVESFVFISKFCTVTYLDFLHACNIRYATSNRNVWEKVFQRNFLHVKNAIFENNTKSTGQVFVILSEE